MAKLSYLHDFSLGIVKQICHRDLKLENTLLDGSTAPRLKICDFGYSKVLLAPNLLYYGYWYGVWLPWYSGYTYIMQHDMINWSLLYCSGLVTIKKQDYLYFIYLIYCHAVFWIFLQSSLLHSQPKSTVGTPAYIAPEVLMKNRYNGKVLSIPPPWCFKLPSDILLLTRYIALSLTRFVENTCNICISK